MGRKRESSREVIIEVARRHFTEYGYKRTVIDEIVREVGIAKGTFYFHFKSTEELFFEVVDSISSRLMQSFQEGVAKEATALGRFRFMLRFTLEAMEREPLIAKIESGDLEFRLMMKMAQMPKMREEIDRRVDFIRAMARDGIESGELRPDLDLEVLPYLFGSFKFLHFYIEPITMQRISREQFVDGLIDLVASGLANRGKGGGPSLAKRKDEAGAS